MSDETFMMATMDGKVSRAILAEFEYHGEVWVIHTNLGRFSASHKATGWGLPATAADTVEKVKELAIQKLDTKTPDQVAEILKEVSV